MAKAENSCAKIIVVTSGKGGVGKTTVCAFLGAALAARGRRTIVCDLDFGLNNLDVTMGLETRVVYDIGDALGGRCRANQAIIASDAVKNLFMISSGHTYNAKELSAHNLKQLFEGLKPKFDYILLDCPAGIDAGFHRAVCSADEAVLVVTPSLTALRDADKVLSILRSYKLEKISAVVNLVRGDLIASGEALSILEIENLLKLKIIGAIPQDDDLLLSKNCFLYPDTRAGEAFCSLAKNLISGKVRVKNYAKEYFGLVGSVKRKLKRIL